MDAWADERKLRISYESRASAKAFDIQVTEFKSIGNIKIKDHLENVYEFSQIYIDTKKKEMLGTDLRWRKAV